MSIYGNMLFDKEYIAYNSLLEEIGSFNIMMENYNMDIVNEAKISFDIIIDKGKQLLKKFKNWVIETFNKIEKIIKEKISKLNKFGKNKSNKNKSTNFIITYSYYKINTTAELPSVSQFSILEAMLDKTMEAIHDDKYYTEEERKNSQDNIIEEVERKIEEVKSRKNEFDIKTNSATLSQISNSINEITDSNKEITKLINDTLEMREKFIKFADNLTRKLDQYKNRLSRTPEAFTYERKEISNMIFLLEKDVKNYKDLTSMVVKNLDIINNVLGQNTKVVSKLNSICDSDEELKSDITIEVEKID